MSRKVCITAVDGQTGFLIAERLLKDGTFRSQLTGLTGLALDPTSPKAKELRGLGAVIVPHKPGCEREVAATLKKTGCDTICLVPPTHADKFDIAVELSNAAKKAGVANVLLISSAGCGYAEREFIDLESVVFGAKRGLNVPLENSPCVIR